MPTIRVTTTAVNKNAALRRVCKRKIGKQNQDNDRFGSRLPRRISRGPVCLSVGSGVLFCASGMPYALENVMTLTRRRFLLGLVGAAGLGSLPAAAALPTPRQSAGPFYPDEIPLDDDNDLVRVKGRTELAKGRISDLSGRLVDVNGRPIEETRIEIWQCDANGRYRHSRDPGRTPIDADFQGFGRAVSDADGRYRFRTIRPVPYPGRTPHIHVAVYPAGDRPFVTQLYVAGETRNAEDFLYRRIPVEQRDRVTVPFEAVTSPDAELAARWDIVLDRG